MMNQYIIPLPQNDPRLFSHVSQAFSLVDLGKRLLDAAKNGDVEEVKNLMTNGAPFTTDWLGISPLHFAAMNGHLSSCDALLRAGISRDARTKVDRTPLHLAAQEGHADIVELLLKSGADLEARDMLKMTALHWAAERGHAPVVQMLMRYGADAHMQNKFELSPLDIAESKGHLDARDAMLNTHFDMGSSVGRMAATNGDIANAPAYILTDEETLVPAAPPADEVTVTATTVEEENDRPHTDSVDPKALEKNAQAEILDPTTTITSSHSDNAAEDNLFWQQSVALSNDKESEIQKIQVKTETNPPTDEETTLAGSATLNGGSEEMAPPTDPAIIPTVSAEEDCGRNVMLVETPDGEVLYVRQHDSNTTGSNGLAIYSSSGAPVNNPTLLAQVVNAMTNLTKQPETDKTNSQSPTTADEEDGSIQLDSRQTNSVHGRSPAQLSPTILAHSNGPTVKTEEVDPEYATTEVVPLLDVDETTPTRLERLSPTDDRNSLVAQLAAFARDENQRMNSLCVEGIGYNATNGDVFDWCLENGIFIREFDDEPNCIVEFFHRDEAFTLSASYDPESGLLSFYHLLEAPLSC